jgi:uncharacterized delta-60 repeat protein
MSARLRRGQLPLVAVMLCAGAAPASAASGPALDTSFGKAGVARVSLPRGLGGFYPALAPVRQPDGGLLVSADIESVDVHGPPEAIIARFDRRGRVDRSFGKNGTRRFRFGGFRISSIVPLPDGRTLVAGTANAGENLYSCAGGKFALIRLRRDGSLDRSFGHRGSVTWRPARLPNGATYPDGQVDLPSATSPVLMRRPDGSLVAAGSVCDRTERDHPWENGFSAGLVWARFDANGHLDTSAGSDGAHRLAVGQGSGEPFNPWKRWLPQPGGNALALETAYDHSAVGRYTVRMRSFSPAEFADPEPASGWINVTTDDSGSGRGPFVAGRDGGLFIAQSVHDHAAPLRIQRVLASGSLDATYGQGCPQTPTGPISGAAESSTGGLVATTWAFVRPRRHVGGVLYFSPSGCLERRLNIGPTDLQLGTPLLQRGFRPVIGATTPRSLAAVRLVRAGPR